MSKAEKREKMLTLVSEWKGSGLSQRDFAAQQNVKFNTFMYWVRKSRGYEQSAGGFIQLSGNDINSGVTIRYPNGVELVVPARTPVNVIRNLILI